MVRIGDEGPKIPEHRVQPTEKPQEEQLQPIKDAEFLSAIEKASPKQLAEVLKVVFGIKKAPKLLAHVSKQELLDVLEGTKSNAKLQPILEAINAQPERIPDAIKEMQLEKAIPAKVVLPPKTNPGRMRNENHEVGYNPDPGAESLSPPVKGAPAQVQQIYTEIKQLNGMQDWFKSWLGGSNPTSPAELSAELKKLQANVDALQKQGITDQNPDLAKIKQLIQQDSSLLSQYQAIATQKFGTAPNQFEMQDLIFGNPQSPFGDITKVWNQINQPNPDPTALQKMQNIATAFHNNIGTIQSAISKANQLKTPLLNDLFFPNSSAYTAILDILVNHPNTSISDESWITPVTGATFLWTKVLPNIQSNQANWSTLLQKAPYNIPNKAPDFEADSFAAKISGVFQQDLKTLYGQIIHAKPPPDPATILSQMRQGAALGQNPLATPPPYTTDQLNNLISLFQYLFSGSSSIENNLSSLQQKMQTYQTQMSSVQYQLSNDLLAQVKYKATDDTTKQIQQALSSLKTAGQNLISVNSQSNQIQDAINSLISKGVNEIVQKQPFDLKSFKQQVDTNNGKVTDLMNSSAFQSVESAYNSSESLINGPKGGLSLVQRLVHDHPDLAKDVVGPTGGVQTFKRESGQTGIWFDTSRIPTDASKTDVIKALDKYFQEGMLSGVTEMKLSFGQFTGGGQANTLANLLKQVPLSTVQSEAAKYGVSIGISFGGEDANGDMLKICPTSMSGNPSDGVAAADAFYKTYLQNASSIDFDLEGQGLADFLSKNSQPVIIGFFNELHKLAAAATPPKKIELTLCGSVGTNAAPLAFLFNQKPCPIDQINVMAYNDGAGYYLSTTNADYGTQAWIQFLCNQMGLSTGNPDDVKKAMSMLSFDFEDATPYNDASPTVTQTDPWAEGVDAEIYKRTGLHLNQMTPGAAANEILTQLTLDTSALFKVDGGSFAPPNWWIDSNRCGIQSGTLALYPEAQQAADANLSALSGYNFVP